MQEMIKARIDETGEWVRCGCCGHKLFRVRPNANIFGIEIKCKSCRALNYADEDMDEQENDPKKVWIFTFGSGQKNAGHYVQIYGTFSEARQEMINRYGMAWAGQYSEEEWQEWVLRAEQYGVPVEKKL